MPRRIFAFVFPLLLVGCGGGGAQPEFLSGTLGASSIDLLLAPTSTAGKDLPTSPSMRGSGRSAGRVKLTDATPDGTGVLEIDATVEPRKITNHKVLLQGLSFDFAHAAGLAVGTALTVDGTSPYLFYDETTYDWNGISLMNGESVTWYASGGRFEVAAHSGSSITFRLTGITMVSEDTNLAPFTMSGTVSGTIQPS